MTGIDFIVSRKIAELLQTAKLLVHVSAREVGSAAAAAEKRVAGEQSVFTDNADAAGCVTGGGEDLETQTGKAEDIMLLLKKANLLKRS